MKTVLNILALVMVSISTYAQTAESLKQRIQEHYKAISGNDVSAVTADHREDFTVFLQTGGALYEAGFEETATHMGAVLSWPQVNVTMKHFNAQIYDNTGIATFYLEGSFGEDHGIWRVSAVWIWQNGSWKEAHHHESRLKI